MKTPNIYKIKASTPEALFIPLNSLEQFFGLIQDAKNAPVLIYKHSQTCSASSRAHHTITQAVLEKVITTPVRLLIVQNNPDLKLEIAKELHIPHESPQLLALHPDGRTQALNHEEVTLLAIKQIMSYESDA